INGRIFKSTNSGLNWSNITDSTILPNRYVTDLALNPNDPNILYAAYGGFGTGHIFFTSNGGNSWQNISANIPDVPHHSVTVDPVYNQNIYLGNDLGVYVTTNAGINWNEYMKGMPYALIFDLSVVNANRKLRAATYGNGIYERKLMEVPVSINNTSSNVLNNYELFQNYPNPFNPITVIKYKIQKDNFISLKIFDVSGKEIITLVNEKQSSGIYKIDFNASDLPSGIYFYTLKAGDYSHTKTMIFLK
ncbi:MAG: T9SS type A sorting domain-containing protein, partial [Ignavibacteria bacterium]